MQFEFVKLAIEGHTALLTIERPKALNALNLQTLREMESAIAQISLNTDLRALIVTGAGEKSFVAGADISEMANYNSHQAMEFSRTGQRVLAAIDALPFPSIAAVNGFALGGGCELALACDLIYASEKAKFGVPEVSLGVIPGFGGTQRLLRLLGPMRAKELILTGDTIDAAKAKEIGLVGDVFPIEKLLGHCREVADRIAKKGPLAVRTAKHVLSAGADIPLANAVVLEQQAFGTLFGTADQKEGMKAFLEKRPATFVRN